MLSLALLSHINLKSCEWDWIIDGRHKVEGSCRSSLELRADLLGGGTRFQ